ncbi:MAG: type II secretion system F family protein [Deltaproteobacteria bacterium]|nr:type II secretion system F family protein [Deltaproteobacteria bacterium]
MGALAIAFLAAIAGGSLLLNYCFAPARIAAFKRLAGVDEAVSALEYQQRLKQDVSGKELERAKIRSKLGLSAQRQLEAQDRFFQAGMFSDMGKRYFSMISYATPVAGTFCGFFALASFGADLGLVGAGLGFLLGMQLPRTWITRRIAARSEDIMFYLPLVIEQIVIGVSSSLDVGPCIQRVVSMADERDTHNPVTELMRHSQNLARSGIPLEEALTEVGRLSGHTELKHAFMSLGQVSRHGGEITRQLQELANAVAGQRETKIEAKIRRLELEATGPVGMVFLAFLSLLLIGIGMQVLKVT